MISVCLTTHNGERFLKDQLDSILSQLRNDDELIISDDGSTDNTVDLILALKDNRVHLFTFKQPFKSEHTHCFVSRNFENALKHANGEYIFLADQDDWWMPDKVEKCVAALKDSILVVHQAELCDSNLNFKGQLMYKERFVFKNYLSLKRGKYYGCTIAFRKELLGLILPFPRNLVLHDQWIGCIAEMSGIGHVYYERTPLIKYRLHSNNTSSSTSRNSLFSQIWYRVYMFYHMIKRVFFK